jgi:hypothetical protein
MYVEGRIYARISTKMTRLLSLPAARTVHDEAVLSELTCLWIGFELQKRGWRGTPTLDPAHFA